MADPKFLTIPHLDRKAIGRLFSKISIDRSAGCWNWTGAGLSTGYGMLTHRMHHHLVHRFVYAWLVGPIPMGRGRDIPQLDHLVCDNKRCCNPAHLSLVRLKDNLMRGNCPTAINARKTRCPQGHLLPITPNSVGSQGPFRRCRACVRDYSRRYYRANHDRMLAYAAKSRARRRDLSEPPRP